MHKSDLKVTSSRRFVATGDEPFPYPEDEKRPRATGKTRQVLGWLFLAGLIVALWPAAWGGVTGFTVVHDRAMAPAYETNDLVLTLKHSSYAVGDVIAYEAPADQTGPGGQVIRRIIAVDDGGAEPVLTTGGDNDPSADPWELTAADVTGTVTLRAPGLGSVIGGTSTVLLLAVAGLIVALAVLWPSGSRGRASRRPRPIVIRSGF